MTLTGEQREAIQMAIGDAFTVDTLAQCVRFKLDRDLEDVTLASNKPGRIFDLIDAAEREGWTETLLIGLKNCSGQPELRAAINAVLGMQPIASAIDGRVLEEMPADARTAEVDAGAHNLPGNIASLRHDPIGAIDFCSKATTPSPDYAHAWHDMVAAFVDVARSGDVRIGPMREALDAVKRTGAGVARLGRAQLRLLERNLSFWERGGCGREA